jgi:DNA helicase HerA-like ATPase
MASPNPLIHKAVGIFRGFIEGQMEFHADLVLPYRPDYLHQPMHGQFLLVQLAHEDEAILGRITALRSEGRLASPEGEDYSLRSVMEGWELREDIRERYVRYRVNVRVLGVVRRDPVSGRLHVAPSHRRLPHVGSPVAFPDPEVLRELAGHEGDGAVLGFLAMGEFVWGKENGKNDEQLFAEEWMRVLEPTVRVRFRVQDLVARRTFVFARAGYGKSNLIKVLFSELYRETPKVPKRGGRQVPVGTIIFDRDAEYFWPDDKGRPGLCDVPHLADRLVVFTDRKPPDDYYGAFVADRVALDLRRLPPAMVVGIALSPERQDQQNVRKLRAMPQDRWRQLVDLIHRHGHGASLDQVANLMGMEESDSRNVEATAARSNMVHIVQMLHDPNSRFLDLLKEALRQGKLCVVDLSRMSGEAALAFSGIVLAYLFEHNQEEFVKRDSATIPVIAVLEEAQSVLGQGSVSGSPYVRWVKEGRKYDLGAVMITQQPGSIPAELLSQGDNWFVFHVLSAEDLKAVGRANAHFSADLLASLLNEPIPGHCVFWSGVSGRPYPIPVRVVSFEQMYRPGEKRAAVETCIPALWEVIVARGEDEALEAKGVPEAEAVPEGEDYLSRMIREAREAVRQDPRLRQAVEKGQFPWRWLVGWIKDAVRKAGGVRDEEEIGKIAYSMSREVLKAFFGKEGEGWHTESTEDGKRVVVLHPEARERFLSAREG